MARPKEETIQLFWEQKIATWNWAFSPRLTEPPRFRCGPCRQDIRDEQRVHKHIRSNKHRDRVEQEEMLKKLAT